MAQPPQLEKGDSGRYVTYLQQFLTKEFVGSMTIPPDVTGHFDDLTFAAVEAFQARYALEVDGIVGPNTWAVIIDMDPTTAEWGYGADVGQEVMDMAPELVGEHFQEPRDPLGVADPVQEWEDRLELNGRYLECTRSWELFPVLPEVNARFAQAVDGYQLTDFEYDSSHGYASNVLRVWFAQLAAVNEECRVNLSRVADIIRTSVSQERANPTEGFDGFLWGVAKKLGGAAEPRVDWFLNSIDGELAHFEGHAAAGRLRSAAEALVRAMNVQSLCFAAWEEYIRNATFGLEVMEFTREVVEEVAEEILIAAATGGIGGYLVKAGVNAGKAARTAGKGLAHGMGEVYFSAGEAMSHVLQGTSDQFDLTAEMKGALGDAVGEFGGGVVGKFFDRAPVKDDFTRAFGAAVETTDAKVLYLLHRVSDRVVTDLRDSLGEAMVSTVADGLVGEKFKSTDDFIERLTTAFLTEHGKNVMAGALIDVSGRLDASPNIAEVEARLRDITSREAADVQREYEDLLTMAIGARLLKLGSETR